MYSLISSLRQPCRCHPHFAEQGRVGEMDSYLRSEVRWGFEPFLSGSKACFSLHQSWEGGSSVLCFQMAEGKSPEKSNLHKITNRVQDLRSKKKKKNLRSFTSLPMSFPNPSLVCMFLTFTKIYIVRLATRNMAGQVLVVVPLKEEHSAGVLCGSHFCWRTRAELVSRPRATQRLWQRSWAFEQNWLLIEHVESPWWQPGCRRPSAGGLAAGPSSFPPNILLQKCPNT